MGDSYVNYNYKSKGREVYFTTGESTTSREEKALRIKYDEKKLTFEQYHDERAKVDRFARKNNIKSEGTAVKVYSDTAKIEEFANDSSGKIIKISHYALQLLEPKDYDPLGVQKAKSPKNFVFLKIDETNEHYKFWLGAVVMIFSLGILLAFPSGMEYFFSGTKSSVVAFPTVYPFFKFKENEYVKETLSRQMGMWFGSDKRGVRNDYIIIADKFLEKFYRTIAKRGDGEDLDAKKIKTIKKYFEKGFKNITAVPVGKNASYSSSSIRNNSTQEIDDVEPNDNKRDETSAGITDNEDRKKAYKDLLALFLVNHLEELGLVLSSPEKQLELNREILAHAGEITETYAGVVNPKDAGGGVYLQQIRIGLYKGGDVEVLLPEQIYAKLMDGEDCRDELIKWQFSVGEEKFRQEVENLAEKIIKDCGEDYERYTQICNNNMGVLLRDSKRFGTIWKGPPEEKIYFSDFLRQKNKTFLDSYRIGEITKEINAMGNVEDKYKYFESLVNELGNGKAVEEVVAGGGQLSKKKLCEACKNVIIDYVKSDEDKWLDRYREVKNKGFCNIGDFGGEHSLGASAKLFFESSLNNAPSIAEKIACYDDFAGDTDFLDCVVDDSSIGGKQSLTTLLQEQLIAYLRGLKEQNSSEYNLEIDFLKKANLDLGVKMEIMAELAKIHDLR